MDLQGLNNRINELLTTFEYKDLPNYPNLNGVFNSTNITFAIISGQTTTDPDFINVKINFSIASQKRIKDENNPDDENLYNLVQLLTYKLQKQKVAKGTLLRLSSFENFTPESGLWRSLLTFYCDIPILSEKDDDDYCVEPTTSLHALKFNNPDVNNSFYIPTVL